MSLRINKGEKPKIADKDIICYKGFDFDGLSGSLISPWKHASWNFLKDPIMKAAGDPEVGEYYIDGGYIHSFKDASGIKEVANNVALHIECIIPKGTEYYEGIEFDNLPGYASKEVRFSKILESKAEFPISPEYTKIIQEDSLSGDLVEDTLTGKRFKRFPLPLDPSEIAATEWILEGLNGWGYGYRRSLYRSLCLFQGRSCISSNYVFLPANGYKEVVDQEELEDIKKTLLSELCFLGCTSIGRVFKGPAGKLHILSFNGMFNEAWKKKTLSDLILDSYNLNTKEHKSLLVFGVERFMNILDSFDFHLRAKKDKVSSRYEEIIKEMSRKVEEEFKKAGYDDFLDCPHHCRRHF